MKAIVTIKLPRNPKHNPLNKQTGICPVSGWICTDITGEHHSYLETGDDITEIMQKAQKRGHVTRVEAC